MPTYLAIQQPSSAALYYFWKSDSYLAKDAQYVTQKQSKNLTTEMDKSQQNGKCF